MVVGIKARSMQTKAEIRIHISAGGRLPSPAKARATSHSIAPVWLTPPTRMLAVPIMNTRFQSLSRWKVFQSIRSTPGRNMATIPSTATVVVFRKGTQLPANQHASIPRITATVFFSQAVHWPSLSYCWKMASLDWGDTPSGRKTTGSHRAAARTAKRPMGIPMAVHCAKVM